MMFRFDQLSEHWSEHCAIPHPYLIPVCPVVFIEEAYRLSAIRHVLSIGWVYMIVRLPLLLQLCLTFLNVRGAMKNFEERSLLLDGSLKK